jgi:uncharacterized protein YfaS (alpha-2-macroglobulin family)
MPTRTTLAALGLALAATAAGTHAATLEAFSPQGEVKGVRQVAARFSAQIVPFGDPRLVEPFDVGCPEKGVGRWADGRNWVYDFARDLPAGVVCTFTVKPGLKTLGGEPVDAAKFEFTTGGPAIKRSTPYEGSGVDEEQVFILALDAPATDGSIEAHAYCAVEGIGERIGVRLLGGDEKARILANRNLLGDRLYRLILKDARGDTRALLARIKDPKTALPVAVVQCRRPLPSGAALQLIWGKGIATANGVATSQDQRLAFRVRPAFMATFHCTRVNAQSPCVPTVPLEVAFSAPIARADAARIVLRADGGSTHVGKLPEGDAPFVTTVRFTGPLPERTHFRIEIPSGLKDDAGRRLANASSFPLAVATDDAPPLAKFPGRFGILEANAGALLPVTMRNLEPEVAGELARPDGIPGAVAAVQDDAAIIGWLKRLNEVRARALRTPRGTYLAREGEASVFADGQAMTRRITVPKPGGPREFEVVGIPLERPGFYVLELASPRLGAALHGESKPYFVQTAALVTNLAAHLKWGGDSSLVWVTTLDRAQPVAGAEVTVRDCNGTTLWSGLTGGDGVAAINEPIGSRRSLPHCPHLPAELFVSARRGGDLAFVLSSWDEGIQPWQFNLPTGSYEGHTRAHTVFDRTLLRAGETVGMKHFLRARTMDGFALPGPTARPARAVIEHQGSGQRFEVPVKWDAAGTAEGSWAIPKDAKLGTYRVLLDARPYPLDSGAFRVEEFRVPTMKAVIQPPREPLVNPKQAHVDVMLSYLSGGGAGNAAVKLRTQVQPRGLSFPDYPDFGFGGADVKEGKEDRHAYAEIDADEEETEATPSATQPGKLAQVLPLTLDPAGAARATLDKLPAISTPQDLLVEMEYQDANGETLAAAARVPLWPARINLGIRTEGWAATKSAVRFQVLALDLRGKPVADTDIQVDLFQRKFYSHRKRLIGGFYAYEDWSETTRLGEGCAGRTDAKGLLVCSARTTVSGEVLLRARAADGAGNTAVATRSVYVVGAGRQWFRLGDNDRIDVLPEKKRYEPGEKARFQVRMPFADATALVTIEREGVIDRRLVRLSGREPVIEVPLRPEYSPNVFVSVLAVRGRLEPPRGRSLPDLGRVALGPDVPFGIFGWLPASDETRPKATVDLGKPAFKLGMAEINVGWAGHELKVDVRAERETYNVRDRAVVRVAVKRADGGALPTGAELALAAVDEGLLELAPNESWKLLEAMMQRRPIEVATATAQSQVVGKRHFGKKAARPGGGGGRQAGRELFDTLLLWKPRVALDATGEARVEVPLNDSLTGFRIVAVAHAGAGLFGTGAGSIRTTQDVMLHAGLPPLVREGDEFRAGFTVRNASDRTLALEVAADVTAEGTPVAAPPKLAAQAVELAPGEARELGWVLTAPVDADALAWDVTARARDGSAADRMRVRQRVTAAHPVRVYQATIAQLGAPLEMPVAIPADATPGRGGVSVALRASIAAELDGVREYMQRYPYTCLEQRTSRAIVLRNEALWRVTMNTLPAHLDRDGLARYFASDWLEGSDALTAYVLAIAREAGWEIPEGARERMLQALAGFVEGRVVRHSRLPTADLAIRKVAALDALSRYGRVEPRMLDSLTIEPNLWPTSAVIDWLGLLERSARLPRRAERLAEAKQIVRSRLNFQGTVMGFSTERTDALWWLMVSPDQNAVRGLLALLEDPAWREDMPRMVRGAAMRQRRGHWNTTLANAWGVLAMEKFAARFEATAVAGTTGASLAGTTQKLDWLSAPKGGTLEFPWPARAQPLGIAHAGGGKPWVTITSRAALPLKAPLSTGYTIRRTVAPVEQKTKGEWTRGDVYRVALEIDAQSDMTWVVVSDPIPAGASILGSGLGRDSQLLTQGERRQGWVWPAFEERSFEAFRAYYEFVPKGKWTVEYTARLNNEGAFDLPSSRVEAMYAPEMFGEVPNARVVVRPR